MKTAIKLLFVSAALLVFSACKNETKTEGDGTVVDNSATTSVSSERQGQAFIEGDESTPNILQVAIGSPDHTTLVAAVQAANLENALVNAGPLMVF
ncbi:MAG TPA: fasciclin, partial [Aequorivita sp.]|nr:fasciclin [Aequorivita sp.]